MNDNTIMTDFRTSTTELATELPKLSAYDLSKAGRHAEAIEAYKAQIEANPGWTKNCTSLGWEVYRRLQQIEKEPENTAEVISLLTLGPLYAKGVQGTLYSCLMRMATTCTKTRMVGANENVPSSLGKAYLEFIAAMGIQSFSEKDMTPYTPEPNKEYPSLCENVAGMLHKIVKGLSRNARMDLDSDLQETLKHHLSWIAEFLGACVERFPKNVWMPYYYGQALITAGQKAQARESMLKLVKTKPQEFWAWDTLADTFVDSQDQMLACYCKALTCPSPREYTVNVHRKLEKLLQSMGMAKEAALEGAEVRSIKGLSNASNPSVSAPSDETNTAFYARYAEKAEAILMAYQMQGRETKSFEGPLRQRDDQPFAFVENVFIHPSLLKPLVGVAPGTRVRGVAVKDWDQKKQREGWKALSIECVDDDPPF